MSFGKFIVSAKSSLLVIIAPGDILLSPLGLRSRSFCQEPEPLNGLWLPLPLRLRLLTLRDDKLNFIQNLKSVMKTHCSQTRIQMCEFLLNFQPDKTQICACQKVFWLYLYFRSELEPVSGPPPELEQQREKGA